MIYEIFQSELQKETRIGISKQEAFAIHQKYVQKCAHVFAYYDKEFRDEQRKIYYTYHKDGVTVSQEERKKYLAEMMEVFNKYDQMEALETPTADTIEFSLLPDDFVRCLFLKSEGGAKFAEFDDEDMSEEGIDLEDFWNIYKSDAKSDAEDYWDSKKGRHGDILASYIENNKKRIEGLKKDIEGLKESIIAAHQARAQSKPYFPQSTKSST